MPLLPKDKQIYKKPPIEGTCSYCTGDHGHKSDPACEINPVSPIGTGSSQPKAGEIAFWPDEAAGDNNPKDSFNRQSSLENGRENQSFTEGQARLEREAAEKARRKADEALEKRVEQCMREGYEQGKLKAEDECRSMRESASAKMKEAELCLREARQQAKEIVAASERKIVELAVAVAERLIRDRLDQDPETVINVARETINILNGGEQVELYVNPSDLEICRAYSERIREEFSDINRLEVLPDENIPRGSCRVESESGVAEYFIDVEKEQLKETLLGIARRKELEQIEEEEPVYGRH